MSNVSSSEAAKAVVRRNTEEVQGIGRFDVFEELFDDNFVDHTPQPNMTPDKAGVRQLYGYIRDAFPDFHAEIHWQLSDGDRVTTYKTYYGTHNETISVAAMRVSNPNCPRLLRPCSYRPAGSRNTVNGFAIFQMPAELFRQDYYV